MERAGGEGRSTDHTLGLRRGQLCLQPPHQRTVGLEVVAAAKRTVSLITTTVYHRTSHSLELQSVRQGILLQRDDHHRLVAVGRPRRRRGELLTRFQANLHWRSCLRRIGTLPGRKDSFEQRRRRTRARARSGYCLLPAEAWVLDHQSRVDPCWRAMREERELDGPTTCLNAVAESQSLVPVFHHKEAELPQAPCYSESVRRPRTGEICARGNGPFAMNSSRTDSDTRIRF